MSLINDLILGFEERPGPYGRDDVARGLSARERVRERRRSRRGKWWATGITLSFIGVSLFWILDAPKTARPPAVAARPAPAVATTGPASEVEQSRQPASEAIPRPPDAAAGDVATTGAVEGTRIERPVRLRAMALERDAGRVLVRISTDGRTRHLTRRIDEANRLAIVLERTRLGSWRPELDLVDTPIRAVSTAQRDDSLHLAFELDPGTHVRTQSLESESGSTLLLDLAASTTDATEVELGAEEPAGGPKSRIAAPLRYVTDSTGSALSPKREATMEIEPSFAERARRRQAEARALAAEATLAARRARDGGDLEQAEGHFREALAHDETHDAALVEWATLLRDSGRIEEAIALAARAHGTRGDEPEIAMLLARLLDDGGHPDEALRVLESATTSVTEAPELHALAAAILQRAGRHEDAVVRYEAIVRRYPGESKWWLGLGISLDALTRRAEAADVYRIAMQLGTLPRASRQWAAARIERLDAEE
ncbi:MAG: tetratricopeptide repeat protein [bacterium]|nr:tetratricopeptide repeat protein [bacterium]